MPELYLNIKWLEGTDQTSRLWLNLSILKILPSCYLLVRTTLWWKKEVMFTYIYFDAPPSGHLCRRNPPGCLLNFIWRQPEWLHLHDLGSPKGCRYPPKKIKFLDSSFCFRWSLSFFYYGLSMLLIILQPSAHYSPKFTFIRIIK